MNERIHLLAIASALAAGMALAAPAAAQHTADSTWSGGTILTMNDKAMRAEAVAGVGVRTIGFGAGWIGAPLGRTGSVDRPPREISTVERSDAG